MGKADCGRSTQVHVVQQQVVQQQKVKLQQVCLSMGMASRGVWLWDWACLHCAQLRPEPVRCRPQEPCPAAGLRLF